jgi:hypothetical protein
MLRYGSRSQLSVLKNAFLVRYDSRQIAFLTLIRLNDAVFFRTTDGLFRHGSLKNSVKNGHPSVLKPELKSELRI